MSLNCDVINGVPTLTQTSATGGFGGTVFTETHIPFAFKRLHSGDCEMLSTLIVFSDGTAKWRSHAFSHSDGGIFGGDTGDAFVITGLHLKDSADKILFTFPKFSSPTLRGENDFLLNDPHTAPNWFADLSFPSNIFNSIGKAHLQSFSC